MLELHRSNLKADVLSTRIPDMSITSTTSMLGVSCLSPASPLGIFMLLVYKYTTRSIKTAGGTSSRQYEPRSSTIKACTHLKEHHTYQFAVKTLSIETSLNKVQQSMLQSSWMIFVCVTPLGWDWEQCGTCLQHPWLERACPPPPRNASPAVWSVQMYCYIRCIMINSIESRIFRLEMRFGY